METYRFHTVFATDSTGRPSLLQKYLSFVDSQKDYGFAWWVGSLLIHSILLPSAFLLAYASDGPALLFLGLSMSCFFVNFIANMGGASLRFRFGSLVFSILIHAVILLVTLSLTF